MSLTRLLIQALGFLCVLSTATLAAGLSIEPFHGGTLEQEQKDAWRTYLDESSAKFGCRYEDDPRLSLDPDGLLKALAAGEDIDPVRMTLRSYLGAGEAVRALLARNIVIQSMTCNPVYLYDGELIGHPAIPFEEYLDIMVNGLARDGSLENLVSLIRTVKIAPLDPRVFWNFFLVDEALYADIGLDASSAVSLAGALNPGGKFKPEMATAAIFAGAINLGDGLPQDECFEITHGMSHHLAVWKDLDPEAFRSSLSFLGLRTFSRFGMASPPKKPSLWNAATINVNYGIAPWRCFK